MCGRFGLFARLAAIEERFDAAFTFDYEPRYNIAPEGPGIAAIRDDTPGAIEQLEWGLVPHWVDDPADGPTLINVRADTLAERPAFRDALVSRRCLVPATNFYEWTGQRGRRVPHYLAVEDAELFAMAGIWDPRTADGGGRASVAIVTTAANEVVGEVHDRMPVVLDRAEEARWLHGNDPGELHGLLDPFPAGRMERFEVPRAVNDAGNEGPQLVEPVGHDQSELGGFS